MKHQVFFFLAFYSFSIHSMNHDISTITKDQLVIPLKRYHHFMEQYFPYRIDAQALKNDIEIIEATELSDNDKKEILLGMRLLPSSMRHDINKVTKNQLINELTDFNFYMKQYHADSFDVKACGQFIIALRGQDKNSFEKHKKEIVASMQILPNFVYERELS